MSDKKGPYWIRATLDAETTIEGEGLQKQADTEFSVNVSFDPDGLSDQDVRKILVDSLREWADSLEQDYFEQRSYLDAQEEDEDE